ncbi:hypothetical protein LWI28_024821 [Acer negundo]|uniref:Uncharacterized protein n=1 Tax=Acer negundo TaxID=4023 RepID=A0AAD5J848_ACENE|nr:hypothetical protein LWI28_024821 [Acer negundo]
MGGPDAVLQTLFYSSQLSSEEGSEISIRSVKDHFGCQSEIQSLETKTVADLDQLEELPLSSNGGGGGAGSSGIAQDFDEVHFELRKWLKGNVGAEVTASTGIIPMHVKVNNTVDHSGTQCHCWCRVGDGSCWQDMYAHLLHKQHIPNLDLQWRVVSVILYRQAVFFSAADKLFTSFCSGLVSYQFGAGS